MLVEVARFFDPEEAWCAESLLRARGFQTYVQNEHLLTMDPTLRVAVGGYGIMCLAQDVYAARSSLRDAQTFAEAEGEDSAALPRRRNWLFLVAALYFSTPLIPIFRSRTGFVIQLFFGLPFVYLLFLSFLWY